MSLHTYQRKITEAQAVQWTGNPADFSGKNWDPILTVGNADGGLSTVLDRAPRGPWKLWVEASQAWCEIDPGDWIIREADGTGWYPCKADIFAATYDEEWGVRSHDGPGTCEDQIDRLADFIMEHIPGEPSQSQGAVDTAIRLLGATLSSDAT